MSSTRRDLFRGALAGGAVTVGLLTAETIYHFAIERVTGALPELAARILGCEAQHWTGLSSLLHNGNPVLAVPGEFVPFATHSS